MSGQVLVDLVTRDTALGLEQVVFDTLEPIRLKGFAAPVPAFAAKRAPVSGQDRAIDPASNVRETQP